MNSKLSKVGVVGAGRVGAAVANALVMMGVCVSVVLYNRTKDKAEGEAWDIEDAIPLLEECDILPTDKYEDFADCDVIVITIGAQASEGQSRLELLSDNADIMRSTIKELDRVAPDAILIIISNPVDVLTRIAIKTSTRPENLIIGSGTVLDTARVRYQLGKLINISKQDANIYVIGEHGDTSVIVWSNALIGAIPLEKFSLPQGTSLDKIKSEYVENTRKRAYAIGERKGGTSHGISTVAAQLVDTVLRDEKQIFTVSVKADSEYKIGEEVVLGLPCIIGKKGIERKLHIPLSEEEQSGLEHSAEKLNEAYESVM
ncbi:L-lactate dehydrogenase [Dulcicalothrix desertica PCC 7102]|uniref:L-lactate dehydrogenase n=1 Tax=Dulcicalothrix desertica PCC 7102 TaxID=232991 RepID=A0A3S1APU4_9CYAN|nr:L-lactate dehydrogenase [Dulcicalothrix desertica]RUS96996.1 L-lactate dehydrogenase [Dulcicalothrix desertica PCC 7102]TWH53967.1 L-lactate dehydrogenase [Dulcicalothrix desertica PCC 7102]